MATLLEKINAQGDESVIYPDTQSSLNYLAAQKKNGRIFGCAVSLSGSSINMGAGVLILYGYRVMIESYETVIDLSSATPPSSAAKYAAYLKITRSGHDISHSFVFYSSSTSVNNSDISTMDGTAHLKICEFTFGPSGASDLVDALATVTPNSSSSASGGIGKVVQAPRLAIVTDRGSVYYGTIVIANKSDYAGLAAQYTVVFQVVRYLRRGNSRKKRSGSKTYHATSGWVYPVHGMGRTRVLPIQNGVNRSIYKFKNQYGYSDLFTFSFGANHVVGDSWRPTRTDGLIEVSTLCKTLFKVGPNGNPGGFSSSTCAKDLFCVRSKKASRVVDGLVDRHGRYARKHNFFKFALEARIYDGRKLVARSPVGNAIIIMPDMRFCDAECGSVNKLFRILVE